jgi:hypothetical protein
MVEDGIVSGKADVFGLKWIAELLNDVLFKGW